MDFVLDLTMCSAVACEQALCLGKIARKGKGKGGGGGGPREPVDKHLRPLFRLL